MVLLSSTELFQACRQLLGFFSSRTFLYLPGVTEGLSQFSNHDEQGADRANEHQHSEPDPHPLLGRPVFSHHFGSGSCLLLQGNPETAANSVRLIRVSISPRGSVAFVRGFPKSTGSDSECEQPQARFTRGEPGHLDGMQNSNGRRALSLQDRSTAKARRGARHERQSSLLARVQLLFLSFVLETPLDDGRHNRVDVGHAGCELVVSAFHGSLIELS